MSNREIGDAERRAKMEQVSKNRQALAAQYADLLEVAAGDREKLIEGIRKLGGIDESNELEFDALNARDLVKRIEVTINELDPTLKFKAEYDHGQTAKVATQTSGAVEQVTTTLDSNARDVDGYGSYQLQDPLDDFPSDSNGAS